MKHKGKGLFYKSRRDKHLGEVVRLRGEGLGYKRIAKKLGISRNLVRLWFLNLRQLNRQKRILCRKGGRKARTGEIARLRQELETAKLRSVVPAEVIRPEEEATGRRILKKDGTGR